MKILLLKDQPKLGRGGEVRDVSSGFARNFLIPHGIAVLFTAEEKKLLEAKLSKKNRTKENEVKKEHEILSSLHGRTWMIRAKANDQGHLFAEIHERNIVEVLSRDGIILQERSLEIPEAIKSLGDFFVWYHTSDGQKEKIHISVLPEES